MRPPRPWTILYKRTPGDALRNMADPFGHGFCLIEFTERGYEAIAA